MSDRKIVISTEFENLTTSIFSEFLCKNIHIFSPTLFNFFKLVMNCQSQDILLSQESRNLWTSILKKYPTIRKYFLFLIGSLINLDLDFEMKSICNGIFEKYHPGILIEKRISEFTNGLINLSGLPCRDMIALVLYLKLSWIKTGNLVKHLYEEELYEGTSLTFNKKDRTNMIYCSKIYLPNGKITDFILIPSTSSESFQFFVCTKECKDLTREQIISCVINPITSEIRQDIIEKLFILNDTSDVYINFPNWKTTFDIAGNFMPDGEFGKTFIFADKKKFNAFYFQSEIIQETNEKGSELAGVILTMTRGISYKIEKKFDPEFFLSGILMSNDIGKIQENSYLTLSLVFPQIHHLKKYTPSEPKKWFFKGEEDYCCNCFKKINISDQEKTTYQYITEENAINFKKIRGYDIFNRICDGKKSNDKICEINAINYL